jgi:phytoene synthase
MTGALPSSATQTPEAIARRSGSNFLVGFVGLEPRRRAGMIAIYAFCRVVDDAVDEAEDPAAGALALQFWRRELAAAVAGGAATPLGRAVGQTIAEHGVDPANLHALLDGMAMDLAPQPFADLPALERYCWHVASAVGLACLPVLGADGEHARRYADRLGIALQLTNILRDLRTDAEAGRIYVPSSWLAHAGVEVPWLRGSGPPEVYALGGPVERLCRRLAVTAAERFAEAKRALGRLPRGQVAALRPARIMAAVYEALLQKLERRGARLRATRVRVPRPHKLWLAARVVLGTRW